MTKSEFIRSQPVTMPVSELITLGKVNNIDLQKGLVYAVRSAIKEHRVPRTTHPASTPALAAVQEAKNQKAQDIFLALAAEIGLSKAIEILTEQRAAVLRMVAR